MVTNIEILTQIKKNSCFKFNDSLWVKIINIRTANWFFNVNVLAKLICLVCPRSLRISIVLNENFYCCLFVYITASVNNYYQDLSNRRFCFTKHLQSFRHGHQAR
jgi:hypothetical protein